MALPGCPETPFGGSPAKCSPQMGNGVIAELVLGEDLVMVVVDRHACPDGNDANEKFVDKAWHVELFDSDFNFLATLGRFTRAAYAVTSVPILVDVARTWFPNHVINLDPCLEGSTT